MDTILRNVICRTALVVVLFISRTAVAQTDECDHDYYYVNLGGELTFFRVVSVTVISHADGYSGGDNVVNIAW